MRISKNGLVIACKVSEKKVLSLIADIDEDIRSRPMNKRPRPEKMIPRVLVLSFLPRIDIKAPMITSKVIYSVIGKFCKAASCAVMVVPMLAPMMIGTA